MMRFSQDAMHLRTYPVTRMQLYMYFITQMKNNKLNIVGEIMFLVIIFSTF